MCDTEKIKVYAKDCDIDIIKHEFDFVTEINEADMIFTSYWNCNTDSKGKPKVVFNYEPKKAAQSGDLLVTFAPEIDPTISNYVKFPFFLAFLNETDKTSCITEYIHNNFNSRLDCCYMYSYKVPHRHRLFNAVSRVFKVDALGKDNPCMEEYQNTNERASSDWVKLAIERYSKYKFVISCENCISPSYITEKLVLPLLAGSIPIYCGHADVLQWVNEDAFIYIPPSEIDRADEIIKAKLPYVEKILYSQFFKDIPYNFTPEYLVTQIKKLYRERNPKVVVLCINCEKYDSKFLSLPINSEPTDFKVYRVVAKNAKVTQTPIEIMYIDCKDTYDHMVLKVTGAIKEALKRHPDLDFIVRVDDDVLINLERVKNYLIKYPNTEYTGLCMYRKYPTCVDYHYGRSETNTPITLPPYYMCAGPLYIINNKAAKAISEYTGSYDNLIYDDCFVGKLLENNGIIPVNKVLYTQEKKQYDTNIECLGFTNNCLLKINAK